MSNLGVVAQKDNQFVAKIATYDLGKRYQFAGPLRGDDEQLALQAPGQRGDSKVLIRLSENVR